MLAPVVDPAIWARRNGVIAFPLTSPVAASCKPSLMASSITRGSASCSAGTGTATTTPLVRPVDQWAFKNEAVSAASPERVVVGRLVPRVQNSGNTSVPWPITGTPSVSRYSSVRGMSRIAFAPAQTTATGIVPRAVRSAETSPDSPRCTPPMPPVANTRIPARWAANKVAATVVAPGRPAARTHPMSRRLTFTTSSEVARR